MRLGAVSDLVADQSVVEKGIPTISMCVPTVYHTQIALFSGSRGSL